MNEFWRLIKDEDDKAHKLDDAQAIANLVGSKEIYVEGTLLL